MLGDTVYFHQFISFGRLYGDTVINALVIATNVGNYKYVLNPLVYYGIVKEKAGRGATNQRGRLPRWDDRRAVFDTIKKVMVTVTLFQKKKKQEIQKMRQVGVNSDKFDI